MGAGNIRSGTPPLTIGSAENVERAYVEVSHVRLSNIARTSFPYGSSTAIVNEPTLAAGIPVEPPITGSPDLAVLSLDAHPNPGGGLLIQAVVRNAGDLATQNGFFTDIYADHLPTGSGDYSGSVHFWVANPIAAGTTLTLTTVVTDAGGSSLLSSDVLAASQETTGTLYAQTDSSGAVGEPDEGNNIYSIGTEVCFAAPDSYEADDDGPSTSNVLMAGVVQPHNFDALSDEDWMQLQGAQGAYYLISTSELGPSADTCLYLYDTDGATLLASNDDHNGTLASQIEWTAPASGTYYVVVRHWNPNVAGCGTDHTISLSSTSRYDFDADCDIDIVDIMGVASRWSCHSGDACYDARYDLDSDGDIDIIDIMAVASRWSCRCGDACYFGAVNSRP